MENDKITVVQNDEGYALNFELKEYRSTDALSLIGATSVVLNVQYTSDPELKFTGEMVVIDDPADGHVQYITQGGNFPEPGDAYAEIQITYDDGRIITLPNILITVFPELPRAIE